MEHLRSDCQVPFSRKPFRHVANVRVDSEGLLKNHQYGDWMSFGPRDKGRHLRTVGNVEIHPRRDYWLHNRSLSM